MIEVTPQRDPYPVLPLSVVLALLYVGLYRMLLYVVVVTYYPYFERVWEDRTPYDLWEFWFGVVDGAPSIQLSTMVVNILLVLFLWVQFRGLPRGSFGQRTFQLVTFGGAAVLLAYLQIAFRVFSGIEPTYFRLLYFDLRNPFL